jgi:hypothetical protein
MAKDHRDGIDIAGIFENPADIDDGSHRPAGRIIKSKHQL